MAPRKQRHTARRIWCRIRAEMAGVKVAESTIRGYVRKRKIKLAATDDQLGLVPASLALYEKWTSAHKSAEMHIYAKGGHGFGVRAHNLPTDHWIDRFADWLEFQGWLKK